MLGNSTWQQATLLGGILFSFYIEEERQTSVYNISRKMTMSSIIFHNQFIIQTEVEPKFLTYFRQWTSSSKACKDKLKRVCFISFVFWFVRRFLKLLHMEIHLICYFDIPFIQHNDSINILLHTSGIFFFFFRYSW